MRPLRLVAIALLSLFSTASAYAVTVDQIVSLSKAGVSEAVLLALLERDGTVLTIEPEQLVSLKRDGLSDTLIAAMLRNGREEGEQAARAVSAWNAATMLSSLANTPDVVVVGHGPDRPNTAHTEDYYRGFRDGVRLPSAANTGPWFPVKSRAPYRRDVFHSRATVDRPFQPMLCLAQVNTAAGRGPAFVTECPPVMQRALHAR